MTTPIVTTAPPEAVKADALVILHTPDGGDARTENDALAGHAAAFARDLRRGATRAEWFCTMEADAGVATRHVLFDSSTFGPWLPPRERLKAAAARAVATCRRYGLSAVAFVCPSEAAGAFATAVAEGALLGDWRDTRFKSAPEDRAPLRLVLATRPEDGAAVRRALKALVPVLDAVNHARAMVNTPGDQLVPAALAAEARRIARGGGMGCTVLDEKALAREGYGLLTAVGAGSIHPPRLIVLRHRPARPRVKEHVVLLGKGICFDTGGLSIKTAESMHAMSYDMAGGAAVLAAMQAVAALALPVRVTAIVPAAINDVDAKSYKPGSILRSKAGRTVYVENSDAEGRLVLADGMVRAREEKADVLVDLATLTGAARMALGPGRAALFTDDEGLASALASAGDATGDALWRLPLVREYESALSHHLADLCNTAPGMKGGGAIHAANFLKAFVPAGVRWAHLDIAGVASNGGDGGWMGKGATGWGVRLLVAMLQEMCGEG